ncbi:MAG: hypothetical protein WCA79_21615 [Anaerolineales bacterium]
MPPTTPTQSIMHGIATRTQSNPSPVIFPITSCNLVAEGQASFEKSLADSHILYKGLTKTKDDSWQFWVLSIGNGKLQALDNYPQASGYLGFLDDRQHFALTGFYDVWLGDIDGSPARKVDKVSLDDPLLTNFRPYSPIWSDILDVADPNPPPDILDYAKGRFHSPNNKKIAIWKRGDQALLLMDQSSKQTTEIVPTEMGDTIDGAWTSDSQWFIFAHTYGDPDKYYSQLLEVSSDGTELRPLTSPFGQSDFEAPIISPDGEKVAFVIDQVSHQTIGLLWLNNGNLSIYQLEPDPRLSLIGEFTVWSPDSQWFAFINENIDGNEKIHIMNIESGNTYCILPSPALSSISMDWR